MSIANVAVTNTLNEFRETTNEVIITLNSITGGNGSISTNTIVANTISANNLTSGRVLIAGTDGLIEDDAGLIYDKTSNEIIIDGSLIANSGIVNNALIVGTVTANNLTSGRVAIVGTSGLIEDDSGITYDSTTDELTVSGRVDAVGGLIGANVTANNLTSGRVPVVGASGLLEDDASFTYDSTNNTLVVEAANVVTGNILYLTSDTGTFSGNVTITGDLTVIGNTTQLNITTFKVDDPIIHLAANNETSDLVDIGFVGHYSDDGGTTKRHTGLVRHASDEKFYLFKDYVDAGLDDSNTTIDPTNNTFAHAELVAGNVESDYLIANTGVFAGNVTASFFIGDGSALANAGATITDDTATAAERYILFDDVTSGPATSLGVSSTKLIYVPSTGNLTTTILTTDTINGNTAFSSNGQIRVPVGTTGERATDTTGAFRFNLDLGQFEGYNGTAWGAVGGGATGGSGDQVFYENDQTANNTYTITAGKNAMATGPLTIASGATITVPTGSRLVIL